MNIGYFGKPGSCKTLNAVKRILENIKGGRQVYTNIEGMDSEECQEYCKNYFDISDTQWQQCFHFLDDEKVKRFWEHVPLKAMIVLDEIQNIFNNLDFAKKDNRDFVAWNSKSRHNGQDLILITQNPDRLPSAIRALIHWGYNHRKPDIFGDFANKIARVAYIDTFSCADIESSAPLLTKTFRLDPKLYPCYKSYVSSDIKELSIQPTFNVFKHPVFFAIPAVLLFVLYFGSRSSLATGDLFGAKKAQQHTLNKVVDEKKPVLPSVSSQNIPAPVSLPVSVPETSLPAPRPEPPQGKLIKISYLQAGHNLKLIYSGQVYDSKLFPYPVTWRGVDCFASIPDDVYESDSIALNEKNKKREINRQHLLDLRKNSLPAQSLPTYTADFALK